MTTQHSPRILKAGAVRGLGSKIAFDYGDLRRQCDDYVQQTRQEAQRLRRQAEHDAAEIRRRSAEEGRSEGMRQGLSHAAEQIEQKATELAEARALEKWQTTFPALEAAAAALVQERDRWLAEWEASAVKLAAAIAEKVLRREIAAAPEIAVELVRETLDLVAGSARLRLKMHPEDVALLGPHAEDVVRAAAACGEVEITADASISRGGCTIESQHGTIDARLETQLERITSELVDQ